MSQPRYQIFVSSTFKDLQDERQAVLNAILKLNQFPAGMEIFPAVNDTAWEHIEKVIEDSDYYVLIIGGKYGSIEAESGISYTEKEYDFAVSKNIPVLAFTRSDEENIPVGKAEMNEEIREKLKKFKQEVGNKHHWNYWKTIDELKANVISSLAMSFAMNPQKGWKKSSVISHTELLERLANLQIKYDELLEENNKLQNSQNTFPQFAQGNDKITFRLVAVDKSEFEIETTWDEIFFCVSETLVATTFSGDAIYKIEKFLTEKYLIKTSSRMNEKVLNDGKHYSLSHEEFLKIQKQFLALKLIVFIEINEGWYWKLSETGINYFLSKAAIQKTS